MAGPSAPKTEASRCGINGDTTRVNKQMHFANAHVHDYMNKQNLVQYKTVKELPKNFVNITLFQPFVCVLTSTPTFSNVKVALLTPLEKLLIRNRQWVNGSMGGYAGGPPFCAWVVYVTK